MSRKVGGFEGFEGLMLKNDSVVDAGTRHQARLTVCAHADGVGDARDLLAILGLARGETEA